MYLVFRFTLVSSLSILFSSFSRVPRASVSIYLRYIYLVTIADSLGKRLVFNHQPINRPSKVVQGGDKSLALRSIHFI